MSTPMTVPDPYSTIVCGASSAGVRQISLKIDEGRQRVRILVRAAGKIWPSEHFDVEFPM